MTEISESASSCLFWGENEHTGVFSYTSYASSQFLSIFISKPHTGPHTGHIRFFFSWYLSESEVKRMFSHTVHTDHTLCIPIPFDSYIFSSNVFPLSGRRNHFSPNKIYVLHKSTVCTFVLPHNATTCNNRNSLSSNKLVWLLRFSWYIIYCSKASAPKVACVMLGRCRWNSR